MAVRRERADVKISSGGNQQPEFYYARRGTGSWWQQISGEAIQGSLKGQKLEGVDTDELSFGVWKRENPNGRVLRPDEKIAAANKYESADWEKQVGKCRSMSPRRWIIRLSREL